MRRVVPTAFPAPLVTDLKDLGRAVRAARTTAGLRAKDAAIMLDMATQTLLAIETGQSSVSLDKVFAAVRGLGVDLLIIPRAQRDRVLRRLAERP